MDSGLVKTYNYFDISALGNLKAEGIDKKDETLKIVAQQLESVFLELVLKSMHEANASMKSEIIERDQEEFYQEMFNQQLALSLSKAGGVGLSEMIYQQLKPKEPNEKLINEQNLTKQIHPALVFNTPAVAKPTSDIPLPPVHVAMTQENEDIVKAIPPKSAVTPADNIKAFMDTLLPHAKTAAEIVGMDPKLLLAQSALETGWGKHILHDEQGQSSHNLFGVKANQKWTGDSVLAQTLEYTGDQVQKVKAQFKSYNSYLESFVDYINLLKNKRYEKALENKADPKAFLTELHQAGYATDPKYVDKILKIYEKFATIE